ncbi:MAG: PAC2 family protein [Candidatus Caldarchaeum sp.]|nr:PAC2 family protein [Candidatus Caldarchaeum sp.]MCS7134157.1 PAC2 family protein [Candidatus Caldarchaeum sp.]MCX8201199.1 PAC2 family protein [Candidatus Caldarchaeum sp.]MDW8063564.1 PAC2 family protein [Candidatus Caldarchaeum sp.]MDW8435361.1 PAC2 family protein [Candidatus Caldarchaeum sp.]
MLETEVFFIDRNENLKVSNGVLVEGLPGIGLVAKVAVAYLLRNMEAKKIVRFFSPFFPAIGYISEGKLIFSFADIYLANHTPPLLILYGNAQPSTSYGQYDLCHKIIDVSKKIGASTVLTIGGYGKESVSEKRTIYCSSTDSSFLDEWVKKVDGVKYSGQIVGAAGLLTVLASESGMRNFSMLVETAEMAPDFFAARRAVEAIVKLLDLKLKIPTAEELSRAYLLSLMDFEAF